MSSSFFQFFLEKDFSLFVHHKCNTASIKMFLMKTKLFVYLGRVWKRRRVRSDSLIRAFLKVHTGFCSRVQEKPYWAFLTKLNAFWSWIFRCPFAFTVVFCCLVWHRLWRWGKLFCVLLAWFFIIFLFYVFCVHTSEKTISSVTTQVVQ